MKKLISFFFILILIITFSSCKKETKEEINPSNDQDNQNEVLPDAKEDINSNDKENKIDLLAKYNFSNSDTIKSSEISNYQLLNGTISLNQYKTSSYNDGLIDENRLVDYKISFLEYTNQSLVRIVNYTMGTSSSFGPGKVSTIATRYEQEHPGYMVVGGINGDFFHIDNNCETISALIQEGSVLKTYQWLSMAGSGMLGWKEDGTLVEGYATFSSNAYIDLMEDDKIKSSVEIASINKNNLTDGINLLSYDKLKETDPDRIYDLSGYKVIEITNTMHRFSQDGNTNLDIIYIEGNITNIYNDLGEVSVPFGKTYLVTKDNQLDYLKLNDHLKCQYHPIGEWKDVTNAAGYFAKILENGESRFYDSSHIDYTKADATRTYLAGDGAYINCKKNRTVVGKKEDGSTVFMTIEYDKSADYGCSYFEAAEYLREIGCTDGWLLDGGGSTSLVTRVASGIFTLNAGGSDGSERGDGNALLFVVKNPGYEPALVDYSRFSLTIKLEDKNSPFKDQVSNLTLTVNNVTKPYLGEPLVFDQLNEDTTYPVTLDYDMNEDGKIVHGQITMKFKTAPFNFPTVSINVKDAVRDAAVINLNVVNPNNYQLSNVKLSFKNKDDIFDVNVDKNTLITNLTANYRTRCYLSFDVYDHNQKKTYHMDKLEDQIKTTSLSHPMLVNFNINKVEENKIYFDYEYYPEASTPVSFNLIQDGISSNITLNETKGIYIIYNIDTTKIHNFQLELVYSDTKITSNELSSTIIEKIINNDEKKCGKKNNSLLILVSLLSICSLTLFIYKKH